MKRTLFNDGWMFAKSGSGMLAALTGHGPETCAVSLPHDAMIHETPVRDAESGGQTGFYPGGEYTYTKSFCAPESWRGCEVALEFGGVYQIARVYLNGDFVASNLHGYGGFTAQIDKYLRFGETNELKVIANNPAPNSRWYSGSGIYRNVYLTVGGGVHIKGNGVRVTTREADQSAAVVEVETSVKNITRERHFIALKTEIVECASGRTAAADEIVFTVYPTECETLRQNIYIENPLLWDCDNPNLYYVKVTLREGENELDSECVRTGLRVLSLDGARGLRINGVPVKQRGACIHHDNGIIGAATFAAAEDKRARELRAAGFNAIRSAHHPMSEEMLDACDKYGLLVMDELSDMWNDSKNRNDFAQYFDKCWAEEAAGMVAKDYNHPCVIMYSSGNEIIDLGHPSGGRLNRMICNEFHRLDPTRFTTTAVNGLLTAMMSGNMPQIAADVMKGSGIESAAQGEDGIGGMNMLMSITDKDEFAAHPLMTRSLEEATQASDIAGLNYLTGRHLMEKALHPNKPILGTETYPADIVRLWRIVEENPHVLGDYTWTGYDYLGEAGCGIFYYDGTVNFSSHFPDRLAYIGDINLIGYRRPISYLRQIVFGLRKAPYIGVIRLNRFGLESSKTSWMWKDNISSWTWPGYEGKPTEVDVYSPDEEVELLLNGVSLGKKPCGRENSFTATFAVNYQPGELVAIGYTGGRETGRYALRTAGSDIRLEARADRAEICAGGNDLAFVTLRLVDGEGNENLSAVKTVSVKVEGAGALQGLGSGEPQPTRSYDDTVWETYDGQLMAAVRSGSEPGEITVTFSAEGCAPAAVKIAVK